MFSKDFLKLVFQGKKKLLKLKDVKFVEVVRYDELSVRGLYGDLLSLDGMGFYFPDAYPKGRQCDREYMFNVANSLHEEIVKQLIEHALKVRHHINADGMRDEAILLNEHWKEELASLPMVAKVRIAFSPNLLFRIKEKWCTCSSRSRKSSWPGRIESSMTQQICLSLIHI